MDDYIKLALFAFFIAICLVILPVYSGWQAERSVAADFCPSFVEIKGDYFCDGQKFLCNTETCFYPKQTEKEAKK